MINPIALVMSEESKLIPSSKRLFFRFSLCALVAFMSACSILPVENKTPELFELSRVEQQLNKLDQWSLFGKLGIRTSEDSVTAAINNWQQTGDQFEIDLSSTFFGLGSSKLYGNSRFLSILQSGEAPVSSYDPDTLIETALGFPLPISHLQHWIKGLPAKDLPFSRTVNDQGLIATLQQENWSLSFSHYHTEHSVPLPGKIKIQRDNIRIIVAVKEWILP